MPLLPRQPDPHKCLQPIRSSNGGSRLPRDQRSTTESTEIHGKENPNQLPLSVSFPGATPARRVGSFRGYAFVMIFLDGPGDSIGGVGIAGCREARARPGAERVAISHGVVVRQVDAIQRDGRPIRECPVGGRLGVAINPDSAVAGRLNLDDRCICPIVQPRPLSERSALTSLVRSRQETQRQTKAWQAKESQTSLHEHEPFRVGPPLAPGLRHRRSDRTMSRGELVPRTHGASHARLDQSLFN